MTEEGVSSVLGTVLMLGLMASLIPGVMLMQEAIRDAVQAEREAAERAAFCARNTDIGPPTCPDPTPMAGVACREVQSGAWVCARDDATLGALENATRGPSVP